MKQETMAQQMSSNNAHKDIPGNPSTAKSSNLKLNDRSNGEALRILSEDDWKFWRHNGYIVIKNAVPKEQVARLANFLWEFEEKDPNDPETWYAPPRAEMKMKELTNTGMVEVYNHQYLWVNRQYISMMPAQEDNEELRQWRISSWQERRLGTDQV